MSPLPPTAPSSYPRPVVELVRAVMDYADELGPCAGPLAHELDDGCDPCAWQRLLDPLPHALRRAAIRRTPAR